MSWPVAELDTVGQLHVMAAALPGVGLAERVIDVPFDRFWARVEDLESSIPAFDPLVRAFRIDHRDGEHITARSLSPVVPVWTRFDVDLRPGWCWMQSRRFIVGMAAAPTADGARTRYAHLEGSPWRRAPRLLGPVMRRVVQGDIRGIIRLTENE